MIRVVKPARVWTLGGVMASVAVGHKKWGTLTTRKAQRRSTRGPRVQSTRRAEGRRQARPQGKHKGEVAGGLTRAGRIPISSTAHREKPLLAQHQSAQREAKARPCPALLSCAFWCFLVLSCGLLWSLGACSPCAPGLCSGVVLSSWSALCFFVTHRDSPELMPSPFPKHSPRPPRL